MKIGSLCSGYGGLDLAVHEVLGGELAWVADIDPGASAILAHRFPSVPNLGDIAATRWDEVEPVDVLTAGFPCQDVSCAGGRAGLREGNRTGVWAYVARAIDELRPSLVVLENVRGLLTFGADSDLEPCPWCLGDSGDESVLRACGAVCADLADLGFDAEWMLVSAAEVGAPHRRERVFIIAWPAADADRSIGGEWRLAAPGQAEGGRPRADSGGRGGALAADPIGPELPRECEPQRREPSTARHRADAAPDTERDRQSGWPAGVAGAADKPGQGSRAEAAGCDRGATTADTERGVGNRRPDEQVGRSHRRDAADGDSAGRIEWGSYELAIRRWERVTGRPAPRPTEPGRTGERLSPRFVEWMMGLPEGWVTDVPGLSRNAQLKALGNGVVPQQAAMALRLLLDRAGIFPLVAAKGDAA